MPDSNATPTGDLIIRVQAMPADSNAAGDIFGGWVMSQMDLAAGVRGAERAGGAWSRRPSSPSPSASREDRRHALRLCPHRQGGRSSVTSLSRPGTPLPLAAPRARHRAAFVMVALDAAGNPTPVRPNSTDETRNEERPGNRRALAASNREGRTGLRRKALSWPEPAAGSAHRQPAAVAGHPSPGGRRHEVGGRRRNARHRAFRAAARGGAGTGHVAGGRDDRLGRFDAAGEGLVAAIDADGLARPRRISKPARGGAEAAGHGGPPGHACAAAIVAVAVTAIRSSSRSHPGLGVAGRASRHDPDPCRGPSPDPCPRPSAVTIAVVLPSRSSSRPVRAGRGRPRGLRGPSPSDRHDGYRASADRRDRLRVRRARSGRRSRRRPAHAPAAPWWP